MTIYFHLPYADKEQAKGLGARYDHDHKLWYAPDPTTEQRMAEHWKRLPQVFPGEDRTWGSTPRLSVDLIPSTCWHTNVRSSVSSDDWKRIADGVKARAGFQCEVCAAKADPAAQVFLEAHELFEFDNGVQRLKRLTCICPACHQAIHFGRSVATGHETVARAHLMKVNAWSAWELEQHLRQAYAVWSQRSRQAWSLDLSIIEAIGVLVKLPTPEERKRQGVELPARP